MIFALTSITEEKYVLQHQFSITQIIHTLETALISYALLIGLVSYQRKRIITSFSSPIISLLGYDCDSPKVQYLNIEHRTFIHLWWKEF